MSELFSPATISDIANFDKNTRYINPKTDFAFKHFFGKEPHKDLLISFLNGIFKGRKVIVDLEYHNLEHRGVHPDDRKTAFDLYCTGDKGEKFIVEMQQAKRDFFKDRMIFYASNVIYQQGKSVSPNWDYQLPEVYLIAIMDFCFDPTRLEHYEHDIRLIDIRTGIQFNDKLGYIFIEMPKFHKGETQLETPEDGWLFSLRYMDKLREIPLSLSDKQEFVKLYKIAEVSNLNPDEMSAYEASLKIARDNYSHDETVRNEGKSEGLQEGLQQGLLQGEQNKAMEIAAKLKAKGTPIQEMIELTGLSIDEINAL